MKKIYTIIFVVFTLFGCNSQSSEKYNINLKDNIYQKYNEFYLAQTEGDFDKVFSMIHQIEKEIYKLNFPELTLEMLKEQSNRAYQKEKALTESGKYKEDMIIENISDTVSYNSNILSLIICNYKGYKEYEDFEYKIERIAISEDSGVSWKFLKINEYYIDYIKTEIKQKYPNVNLEKLFKNSDLISRSNNRDTVAFVPSNQSEARMLEQINIYFNAYFEDNKRLIDKYMYQDIFTHFLKTAPEGINFNKNELKEFFYEQILNTQDFRQEDNIRIIVNHKKNSITYKQDLLYLMSYVLVLSKSNSKRVINGEFIAISDNKGLHWTFVERDNQFIIEILSYKYPLNVINKLLGKE